MFTHDRMPSLPDLPTAYEQGLNFEGTTWSGFLVPKATPPEIVKKLHDAGVAAMETAEVQDDLAKNGTYVVAPERRSTEYLPEHHWAGDREERRAAQGGGRNGRVSSFLVDPMGTARR